MLTTLLASAILSAQLHAMSASLQAKGLDVALCERPGATRAIVHVRSDHYIELGSWLSTVRDEEDRKALARRWYLIVERDQRDVDTALDVLAEYGLDSAHLDGLSEEMVESDVYAQTYEERRDALGREFVPPWRIPEYAIDAEVLRVLHGKLEPLPFEYIDGDPDAREDAFLAHDAETIATLVLGYKHELAGPISCGPGWREAGKDNLATYPGISLLEISPKHLAASLALKQEILVDRDNLSRAKSEMTSDPTPLP